MVFFCGIIALKVNRLKRLLFNIHWRKEGLHFMNKSEFIRAFASNAGYTIKEATIAYDAFVASVQEGLSQGEKIALTGFGTFEIKERPEREAFNPQTKEKITIKASKVPAFKFSSSFKDQFND